MTEQPPSGIGTVAQEAARLIEDMAAMARSGYRRADRPGPYAGEPAPEPASPQSPREPHSPREPQSPREPREPYAQREPQAPGPARGPGTTDESSVGPCSACGAESDDTPRDDIPGDGTFSTCRLCPLCRGIALLRSVRPETVDLMADLAMSVAASLRDVAMRSRASDPAPSARSASGGHSGAAHAGVQDIPVDDESEG